MELSDIDDFELTCIINSINFRMRHQDRFIARNSHIPQLARQVYEASEAREELWELAHKLREIRRNLR